MVPSQEYDENERVIPEIQDRQMELPIEVELLPATEEDEEEFLLSPNVSDIIDSDVEEISRIEPVTSRKRSVDAVEDDLDGIEMVSRISASSSRLYPTSNPA